MPTHSETIEEVFWLRKTVNVLGVTAVYKSNIQGFCFDNTTHMFLQLWYCTAWHLDGTCASGVKNCNTETTCIFILFISNVAVVGVLLVLSFQMLL